MDTWVLINESWYKVAVIHYSCESFYDLPDGRSPRVTSIAVRNLDTGQTESFSIHQRAELRRIPMTQIDIEPYYNELEMEMIQAFYDYVKIYPAKIYLHWNMRDKNYGFQAIEHRFRVLGGGPFIIEDSKKSTFQDILSISTASVTSGIPDLKNYWWKIRSRRAIFLTGRVRQKHLSTENM